MLSDNYCEDDKKVWSAKIKQSRRKEEKGRIRMEGEGDNTIEIGQFFSRYDG